MERARLDEAEMQYPVHADGDGNTSSWTMRSYEQITLNERNAIGDPAVYLQEGMVCIVTMP